ncbi:MAG: ROK family protein [Eubacteriales bacterium]|nr:ROK family protein [Eubacteriales bacterium]
MKTVIIGIDLGGTNTQGAAATLDGAIIRQGKIATRARLGSDTVIEDLAKLVLDLAKGQPIKAVGLGAPGLLDLNAGICRFSCNLGWQDVPIAGDLSRRIDAPVYIDNDVRAAALGEWSRGRAQGCNDFIYLSIGTGIGSGIVTEGRLLRGPGWSAGEVGHMVLDPLGPACACGSRGCLETLASATAIAREGRAAAAANPSSLLNELAAEQDLDAALVFRAAARGDAAARRVVDTAMAWLGRGIANLVNIFNPRLVVIGGGVSLAGEQVLVPVRAQVARYAMPVQREMAQVAASALADRAGVAGALELARQKGATGDCPQWSKGAKYGH